jgi:hypothetical protein
MSVDVLEAVDTAPEPSMMPVFFGPAGCLSYQTATVRRIPATRFAHSYL